MSPAIAKIVDEENQESQYQKGVKLLFEKGVNKVPKKYILPVEERPNNSSIPARSVAVKNVKLPLIDFAELQGPNRSQVLKSLNNACEQYGFFQVVNHGIPSDVISNMRNVCTRFFELPYEERSKYMSSDMKALVRYGTSFNQNKDSVFCWRDFLKLMCHPLSDVINHWPSSPSDFRQFVSDYAKETKNLFLILMEAVLDSMLLGSNRTESNTGDKKEIMKEFGDGSQLMVINCYPPCPEPDLTLGMPPHSDYGFLTLVLQDEVKGLQIEHQGKWFTVEPLPNSFVVNVGDHLEIFSNGRYKSILHRVLVNSEKNRISVATLHGLPFMRTVSPWTEIVDEITNPICYKDTSFATFLEYIASCEPKKKNFLESRKILL